MPAAFICGGLRTPIGRHGGALAAVRADDLAAVPIRALLAGHPSLDPAAIDDVMLGCANQAGEDNRNVARMAALLAGLPPSVPGVTINRLCASGLDAVAAAARAIVAGEADVVIAGGVESMTRAPFVLGKAAQPWQRSASIEDTSIGWRFVNPAMHAAYGVDSMPETGENVAGQFGISRDDQDGFALRSQQRAGAAAAWHQGEITPVIIPGNKGADAVVVTTDEHPRPATTAEQLARLKPVVRPSGTVTAGNASGINDGAAALLIASEAGITRHGLTPIARILGAASAGVEPRIMGIGPVPATQRLMARLALTIEQFDVIELNEAFASQALATLRQLGVPDDAPHVNPHGGAIALGHPLGMSGARLVLTAAHALAEADGDYALCTMCVGVGQGVALALARV
ncbi:3-oxoadipyl-CoA thiolase [Sphingopyxis sp. MC1]|uniref:3-oxoadipyl-CoA thiolase n=1 Tax=Sphingopyxis sp. MC1 TaxID=1174684 RepID=UPI0002D1FF7E|nr:3-oxoadipyl-CoA thiolase [Sphingopyxis sp. MC1]ENY82843.1 beta-ketoadipyl CoA thiolase [Sphingopyxis sp. MC1]MBN2973580.1 3-oxoadipyl-CoA thiolase [Roseomonas aeriglobus]